MMPVFRFRRNRDKGRDRGSKYLDYLGSEHFILDSHFCGILQQEVI